MGPRSATVTTIPRTPRLTHVFGLLPSIVDSPAARTLILDTATRYLNYDGLAYPLHLGRLLQFRLFLPVKPFRDDDPDLGRPATVLDLCSRFDLAKIVLIQFNEYLGHFLHLEVLLDKVRLIALITVLAVVDSTERGVVLEGFAAVWTVFQYSSSIV